VAFFSLIVLMVVPLLKEYQVHRYYKAGLIIEIDSMIESILLVLCNLEAMYKFG